MKKQRLFWLSLTLMMAVGLLLAASLAGAAGPGDTEEILADANDNPVPIPPQTAPVIDCPAGTAPATLYFSDLEADDGGWVESGFGEWEWGEVVPGVFEGCDTVPRPEPAGPYSPINVLGTNLNGCYANAGADSVLTQTFDFSALSAPIELDWWHWYEVFETFDWAIVEINDTQVWRTPGTAATADWTEEVVDLAAYAGNPNVTVEFLLHATTVVNRMGWYLDDIAINYCQPLQPGIAMTKTVGLVPDVCATTDNITIPAGYGGTDVYYCYQVTNTGDITLPLHTLDDSELGNIFTDLAYDLAPGASLDTVAAGLEISTTITETTVNTGTWAATVPGAPPVTASDSATVVRGDPTGVALSSFGADATVTPLWLGGLLILLLAGGWVLRRKTST